MYDFLMCLHLQVAYFYLEIIDNIQQASPDEVFKSQLVTRSSQR